MEPVNYDHPRDCLILSLILKCGPNFQVVLLKWFMDQPTAVFKTGGPSIQVVFKTGGPSIKVVFKIGGL